ncbi:hypothetical protein C8R45DRAFT_1030911, partial [Mycena sanguinolenta]
YVLYPPCPSVLPALQYVPRPQHSASRIYPSRVVVVGSSLLQAARATSSPPFGPQPIRSLRHPNPLRLFSTLTTSYLPLTQSRARFPCCLPLPASHVASSLHCSLAPRLSLAAAVVLASGTSINRGVSSPFRTSPLVLSGGRTRSNAAYCK